MLDSLLHMNVGMACYIYYELPLCSIMTISETNECASTPCMYGGTCTDAFNNYTCACANGYTGSRCETGMDRGDNDHVDDDHFPYDVKLTNGVVVYTVNL